ncbi:hypothetical protein ACP3VZ_03875 [Vibrio sp. PNB22_2_2]
MSMKDSIFRSLKVYRDLGSYQPVPLKDLPKNESGIYLICNHNRKGCYIGETHSQAQDFFERIYKKHTSGSPDRHALARNYQQLFPTYHKGLYPKECEDKELPEDRELVAHHRRNFIRENCMAVYISIDEGVLKRDYGVTIPQLERDVIKQAPVEIQCWNNNFHKESLDDLIYLSYIKRYPELVSALKRQFSILGEYIKKI